MEQTAADTGSVSTRHAFRPAFAWNYHMGKTLLLILLAISIIPTPAYARQIELAWDANPPSSKTAGYRVYYTQKRGSYTKDQMKDVGNATRCTLELADGNWYFTVTAYDSKGKESGYSPEIGGQPGDKTVPAAEGKKKSNPPLASPSPQGKKTSAKPEVESNSAKPLIPPRSHLEYLPKPTSDDAKTSVPPSVNRQ